MRSHPFKWTPFIFGALFLIVLGGWFSARTDLLTDDQLRLAGPIALIVLGLLGLALTFRRKT